MAPLKALKASPGSSAHWVVEAQAAIHRGAASARVDPKGLAAQGGVTKAAPIQTREGALPPHGGEAHESDGAGVPLVAEAPRVSEAEATEASDGDDGDEVGRGPLDHLPDVVEVAPRVSASSSAPPRGGGEVDPGPAVARSGAEADTPEARALGKHAVSPMGSAAVVEQVAVEATPPPP